MHKPELSICLDDLKLDIRPAMDCARTLGFRAIDVGAVTGAVSPGELSQSGRRHLLKHLADLGLRLGSLRGPTGGSYLDPLSGEQRLETATAIIDLAASLQVPVVSTALGPVAQPPSAVSISAPYRGAEGLLDNEPRTRHGEAVGRSREGWGASARLRETMSILADRADRAGVTLAIDATDIAGHDLNQLLAEINCPNLAACCDTGSTIMRGDDPPQVIQSLAGKLRLVRARDATAGSADRPGHETPMGQGALDPPRLLAALEEAGFIGDIVLTRTTGANPAEDLRQARELFEKYVG